MTEPVNAPPSEAALSSGAAVPAGAGALLRAARDRQGLHIAALAASIKVSPRKLEALERNDYSEMPDLAFARALAQSVCRVLKIDPVPVLTLMPAAGPASLAAVSGGINAPFRDGASLGAESMWSVLRRRPLVWAGGALLLAAVVVFTLPPELWRADAAPPAAPASPVAAEPVPALVAAASVPAAAVPLIETVHSVPMAETAAAPVGDALVLRADKSSWVQVVDGGGQTLVARNLQPGETLSLNGALPLRLTIGNAVGTQLSFRGKPVDLTAATRDNIARLQLP